MGWLSEDYTHEGWVACEMPDGQLTSSVTQGGPDGGVGIWPAGGELVFVDGRTAVGWRARCDCPAGWIGPLWRRVSDTSQADVTSRHVYDPDPNVWGEPPEDIEELLRADWQAHVSRRTVNDGTETPS